MGWQIEMVWTSGACRKVEEEVAEVRCRGRNRKTWNECVEDDMKVLGLHAEWGCSGICGGT